MEAIEETCPLEDRVPERKVFQGITEDSARSGDVEGVQAREGAALLTRTISDIAGRRSGISRAYLPETSPSGWGTPSRRCHSTSTATSCRRTRSRPSGSCRCSGS